MNRVSLARGVRIALALGVLGSAACLPRTEPYVSQVTLVSSQPLSATETEYVFELTVSNPLARDFQDVRVEAVPIAGSLAEAVDPKSEIGTLAANASVKSADTITIVHPDKSGYAALDVSWRVSYYQPPPNRAPYASARWPQTVLVGDDVPLDGSASSDPDGDALNYLWTFASMPAGSAAQLVPWNAERTSFVPDLPGRYFVQLVVDDGTLWSAQSVPVPITVIPIDPDPPAPVSIYPEPGMTNVPPSARISVVFSEWIDPASVDDTTFYVLGPDGPIDSLGIRVNGSAVVFEPRQPLRIGVTYQVTLYGTVEDRQGQPLGTDLVWEFSTGSVVDLVAPQVYAVWPPDGATGVVPTEPDAIAVDFTEAIDPTTIASRFSVVRANGTAVPGRVEMVGTYRARFVPELPAGTGFENQTWTATIDAGVLDTSGNVLANPYSWSFATLPSHAPAWLSKPGVGSAADTDAYYAGLPFRHDCDWEILSSWDCGGTGAPELFTDFLWDFGWRPDGEPRGVFYDADDLAVGRNMKCFRSSIDPVNPPGVPFRNDDPSGRDRHPNLRESGPKAACYATNHGPIPGQADHPNAANAIAQAVAELAPFSISAMFKKHDGAPLQSDFEVTEERGSESGGSFSMSALERGDVVTIGPASGGIWGGSILHGENGPDGAGVRCTTTIFDPAPCPLEDAPLFGLLVWSRQVRSANGSVESGYRFVGSGIVQFKVLEKTGLDLRINDHDRGNGSGAFHVPVRIDRANGVSFMVYVPTPNGMQLAPTANLDGEGPKRVPHACMACHGGTWDPETQTVNGATFLPLDVGRLELPSQTGWTRTDQEESFYQLNRMVLDAQHWRPDGPGPIADWINGSYGGTHVSNDAYVPAGWSNDATLYRDVAKPYCLSCHQALAAPIDFHSAAEFRSFAPAIQNDVCVQRSMPHAGPTFEAFWQSGAVDVLRQSLFAGANCGP